MTPERCYTGSFARNVVAGCSSMVYVAVIHVSSHSNEMAVLTLMMKGQRRRFYICLLWHPGQARRPSAQRRVLLYQAGKLDAGSSWSVGKKSFCLVSRTDHFVPQESSTNRKFRNEGLKTAAVFAPNFVSFPEPSAPGQSGSSSPGPPPGWRGASVVPSSTIAVSRGYFFVNPLNSAGALVSMMH